MRSLFVLFLSRGTYGDSQRRDECALFRDGRQFSIENVSRRPPPPPPLALGGRARILLPTWCPGDFRSAPLACSRAHTLSLTRSYAHARTRVEMQESRLCDDERESCLARSAVVLSRCTFSLFLSARYSSSWTVDGNTRYSRVESLSPLKSRLQARL